MIPTSLAFEEVIQVVSFTQDTHLVDTEFGKAPERFNAVHVVFPASELIFMMLNPMKAVTIENRAILRPPTVRVHCAISQNLTYNDGPQRVTRAVINNFDVHTLPPGFSRPTTGVLPLAPRPCLPRTHLASK